MNNCAANISILIILSLISILLRRPSWLIVGVCFWCLVFVDIGLTCGILRCIYWVLTICLHCFGYIWCESLSFDGRHDLIATIFVDFDVVLTVAEDISICLLVFASVLISVVVGRAGASIWSDSCYNLFGRRLLSSISTLHVNGFCFAGGVQLLWNIVAGTIILDSFRIRLCLLDCSYLILELILFSEVFHLLVMLRF